MCGPYKLTFSHPHFQRMVRFSAKLKFIEHRQQRIAEVRSKYNVLKRELELAKQHLMVDPGKWTRECKGTDLNICLYT